MSTPRPGKRVRGSQTGRPIMAAFDLLGRRWALRVLWELGEAPSTFRELRGRCDDVSPTVLNTRLRELREARLIEKTDQGYALTEPGRSLGRALRPLTRWAEDWGGAN
ncbi:MAG: helix-turn-helix transcriptional regulator [Deltaproteobacteria bacterium]|nr:helix-turn-helix transcriptional regulator [Deltaproteobacteria bacterium]MBW2394424.1 helix-turn-helix transcriptional regulator [Deltaproteobacteria bacterium]